MPSLRHPFLPTSVAMDCVWTTTMSFATYVPYRPCVLCPPSRGVAMQPTDDSHACVTCIMTPHTSLTCLRPLQCSPTRRSFLSGRFPNHVSTVQPDGVNLCSDFLPLAFTILPEKLASVGYKNHFVGKVRFFLFLNFTLFSSVGGFF